MFFIFHIYYDLSLWEIFAVYGTRGLPYIYPVIFVSKLGKIVKGHNSQVYSTQHGKSVVYWDIMNKTYEDNLICYDS